MAIIVGGQISTAQSLFSASGNFYPNLTVTCTCANPSPSNGNDACRAALFLSQDGGSFALVKTQQFSPIDSLSTVVFRLIEFVDHVTVNPPSYFLLATGIGDLPGLVREARPGITNDPPITVRPPIGFFAVAFFGPPSGGVPATFTVSANVE